MIQIADNKGRERFMSISPVLMVIVAEMSLWAYRHNLPFRINSSVSTIEEDKALRRVSTSHRTGRAVDIGLAGWAKEDAIRFCKHFSMNYDQYAAINREGEKSLCVYGDARHQHHIHVQIHSRYSVE